MKAYIDDIMKNSRPEGIEEMEGIQPRVSAQRVAQRVGDAA